MELAKKGGTAKVSLSPLKRAGGFFIKEEIWYLSHYGGGPVRGRDKFN